MEIEFDEAAAIDEVIKYIRSELIKNQFNFVTDVDVNMLCLIMLTSGKNIDSLKRLQRLISYVIKEVNYEEDLIIRENCTF